MKYDLQQRVIGFKLCIVGDTPDKRKLEQDIYLSLDCQVPYDVVSIQQKNGNSFLYPPTHLRTASGKRGIGL